MKRAGNAKQQGKHKRGQDSFSGLALALAVLLVGPAAAWAQEHVQLACEPRAVTAVPGEPIRVQLTVQADSAAPLRFHIPADPRLQLRAVEKLPVRRTPEGVIVHQRVAVWQGLEPGTVKMNAITVEARGRKWRFPELVITISLPRAGG